MPSFDNLPLAQAERPPKGPPAKIWQASEPPFEGYKEPDTASYRKSTSETAIVIDNGSSRLRAGWSFDDKPRVSIPPLMAKYKDRKFNRYLLYCGSDIYADGTSRGQSKHAYDPGSNIVNNWDVFEGCLDYTFVKLGIDGGNGGVGRPIVMTEPVANLPYARKTMNEILFECYSAPKVAYGIDSLFSYRYNGGKSGLVISSSHTATHFIPVFELKPLLQHTTRLNWGRVQSIEYLQKLLRLKYPAFPARITDPQLEDLVRDHCYISQDYNTELTHYLDWTGLEERDHIIQWPFTETVVPVKSEEELARAAEKRKEQGRRLQEQAAKMRLEKLVRKEQELEYYKELQTRIAAQTTKKEIKRLLEADDFEEEIHLERRVKEMERSIRKARAKDVGDTIEDEAENAEPPTYPLLDTPDDQLDEEGMKAKRAQRLLKANHDARARAKAEKEAQRIRAEEDARLDAERRDSDFTGWVSERRAARQSILQKMRDRERLKADLSNRKSMASQLRMKSIANLASDSTSKKRSRRGGAAPGTVGGGDADDTFGADDADWGVYRTIVTGEGDSDEEEEDLIAALKQLETSLLEHDPEFTEASTREAQSDWTNSLVHRYLRGPWPFDPESQAEAHQIHLNVERIRVAEGVFAPGIAGVDQAGLVEIASDILTSRVVDEAIREALRGDIFLTGGNTMFPGFDSRLQMDLRACLPREAVMKVRRAKDPLLDAWKGAAQWYVKGAGTSGSSEKEKGKGAFVTKAEYEEFGSEYMKEHDLGNVGS